MTHAKLLLPVFLAAFCTATLSIAQDKKGADEKKAAAPAAGGGTLKTIIDNDKVIVQEVRYKPGETSTMRERGPRVTRALSTGTMERVYPDGKKETVQWKAGDVKYFPRETFTNKNVGKTEMVLFVTTLK
jgi:hypothetical protein